MDGSLESGLAENLLLFCRMLRRAGLAIGPGSLLNAMRAVAITGIEREDDFRFALRAVLVHDPSESTIFEQAFHLCFRDPALLKRAASMLVPDPADGPEDATSSDLLRRLAGHIERHEAPGHGDPQPESDRSATWSSMEILACKDFEQMSELELIDAKRMLRENRYPARLQQARRYRASLTGQQFDLRRSMRRLLQHDGELLQLARQRRRLRPQTLVLLCDISGSMSRYSRVFLQYAHALASRNRFVHVFVFGTRLTNITRWLRNSDVDVALRRLSFQVADWDGGTRIADSLHRFNREWGRRVLAGNASVVLLSDGFERDSNNLLEFEMQRLKRSCRELIWMNPMLRYEKFEAKASGIRAMLPHVDRFVPAHNLESITELGRLLATGREAGSPRKRATLP
jgi:uncharacterized protein with von Willebrand factor type A (vWA) domain